MISSGNYARKWMNTAESWSPVFSSRNFLVSGFTFRYITHFYVTFIYDAKYGSNLIFLHKQSSFYKLVPLIYFLALMLTLS